MDYSPDGIKRAISKIHSENCGCCSDLFFHALETFKKVYPYFGNEDIYHNIFAPFYVDKLILEMKLFSNNKINKFINKTIPIIKGSGLENIIGSILKNYDIEEKTIITAITIFHHHGYSLNKKSVGVVPLEIAYRKKRFNTLDLLVRLGANLTLASNEVNDWYYSGINSFANQIFYGRYFNFESFLINEILEIPLEILRIFFTRKLAKYGQGYVSDFTNILLEAVQNSRKDLIDFFLDEILDINVHEKQIIPSFIESVRLMDIPIILKFLDFGMDVNSNFEHNNLYISAIFGIAVENPNLEMLYHFINYGGIVNTSGNFFMIINNHLLDPEKDFDFFKKVIDCGFSMNHENSLIVKNHIKIENICPNLAKKIKYLYDKGMRIYFENGTGFEALDILIENIS